MTTSAGSIQLDIIGNLSPLKKSLSTSSLSAITKGAVKALGSLVAVGSLAKFQSDCVQAAANVQQLNNRVQTVFPEMTATINDWASNANLKMGMGGGSAKKLASTFGMMAQGMGIATDASAGMSMQMTELAGDMAAFYGITTEEAQSKLTGIFTGMTRGMKTLGVNMSEANLQAHALSLGITAQVATMSEADKAALRLSYAQSQLSKIQGYAEKNTQTYNGQVQLLQQRFGALKATLGQGMIVALMPLVKALNMVMQAALNAAKAFNKLIEAVTGKSLSEMMGGIQGTMLAADEVTEDAADSTAELTQAQEQAAKAAKDQEKAQKNLNKTLAGFDKINRLSSDKDDTNMADLTEALTAPQITAPSNLGLADMFKTEAQKAQSALDKIQFPPKLVASLKKLGDAWERLTSVIKGGFSWVWENILRPFGEWTISELAPRLIELLANAFNTLRIILEKLSPIFEFLWKEVFQPVFKFIGDRVLDILDALNIAWGDFNKILEEADFTEFLDALRQFKETNPNLFFLIAGAITAIALALMGHPILALLMGIAFVAKVIYDNWDGIVAFFQGIWDGIQSAFANVKEWFSQRFENAKTGIQNAWGNITEWFGTKKKAIVDKFNSIKDDLKNKFENAKTAVQNTWGNIQNWFGDKKKEIVWRFNDFKDNMKSKFEGAKKAVQTVWGNMGTWAQERKRAIADKFSDIKTNLSEKFKGARDKVKETWNNLPEFFKNKKTFVLDVFKNIPSWFGQTFGNAWQSIKNKFAGWGEFWGGLWDRITNKFSFIGAALGDTMSRYVRAGLNAVIDAVERRINWAVDLINGAIDLINKIPGVWVGWYVGRLNLPRLAQGGFVARNTPRLAVIGDNPHEGEIVAPESKLQAMADQAADGNDEQLAALLSQILAVLRSQDTNVYLDGNEITRRVVANVNRQTTATGRCPIMV